MSARQTTLAGLVGMLVLATAAGGAATAAADPGADPAARAGAFLERELTADGHVFDYPGTDQPDYGVTIDGLLALAATGTGPDAAAAGTAQVESHLDDYIGPAFGPTELYAGPLAKSALLAMTMDGDPHAFSGRDLLADLADLQRADGRYADRTAYADTSNTFTQGIALITLVRAGAQPRQAGVDFLLDQQCGDGGFKLFVESAECTSDPDATAMAAIALLAVDDPAAEDGLDFLAGRLGADGGIGGGVGAESANTNSTGLAATAFAAAGRDAERERADAFLASMQLGCGAPVAARGAIAYDADAYAALVAAGADAQVTDQERRATSQAAFGLAGASLLSVSIDGATPGSDGCSGGPSTPPTSSPPPSSPPPSSPPPSSPTPSGQPAVTSTTTVTTTVTAPPAPAVTVTVTEDTAGGEPRASSDESGTGDPGGAAGPESVSPPRGPTEPPFSMTATAVAGSSALPTAVAAEPATGTGTGSSRLPYLVAGGMVLLGAAAAAYILIRGRN